MFTKYILPVLAAMVTVFANANSPGASTTTTTTRAYIGPATTATNLPVATYHAVFPGNNPNPAFQPPISGILTLISTPKHPGVHIALSLSHLPNPALYGPFAYHIHAAPVPADGNCSAAGKHLDPIFAGDSTPCDARKPETCQVGDLSGKYGNASASPGGGSDVDFFRAEYRDVFLSTDPASAAFVGGRSVVLHMNNGTRIACANLVKCEGRGGMNGTAGGDGNGTTGAGHGATTTRMPPTTSPVATGEAAGASEDAPAQTDGARALTVGAWVVAAGLVGIVL